MVIFLSQMNRLQTYLTIVTVVVSLTSLLFATSGLHSTGYELRGDGNPNSASDSTCSSPSAPAGESTWWSGDGAAGLIKVRKGGAGSPARFAPPADDWLFGTGTGRAPQSPALTALTPARHPAGSTTVPSRLDLIGFDVLRL